MMRLLKQTLPLLLALAASMHQSDAQVNCNDPVALNSIIVSNTTCGNTTGTVILSLAGGSGAYVFDWVPAVSTTNIATGLEAGTYRVHVERANNPDCYLDTTVLVNNSNGPQVQVQIEPAACGAPTGRVTLLPADLLYNWNTGAGTNVVQGLASGNYYVTATDPGAGCYAVLKIFVPRNDNFPVSATVLKHAKCGKNNGQVQINVVNGSGQYSYSLGPQPVIGNLGAGTYTCFVNDLVTGCSNSVTFTINDLPVSAEVQLSAQNARCPGGSGTLSFTVAPGANFSTPYTFSLTNSNGQAQNPGNLLPGAYTLQVFDADLCPLPPQGFTISQPPPIVAQGQVIPETCAQGGSITLSIVGGNGGPYLVNWFDLPGDINPPSRSNLEAGLYSAAVFDTLFCEHQIDQLLVAPLCNGIDTAFMVLKTGTTELFCREKPVGLTANATTFSLPGGQSGNSAFGAWTLNSDGCLAYSAGPNAGFAVDTICIVRTASSMGLKDTLCLIVTIVAKVPTQQSVFFAVQAGATTAACGSAPSHFQQVAVVQIGRPGLSGTSDVYGQYVINPLNGCLTFTANQFLGFGVDEIRVAVCDTVLHECHLISYLPSVISPVDCAAALQLPDTIRLTTNDCNGPTIACLGVPFDEIVNYTVIDNGALYNAGYTACDPQLRVSYQIASLPAGGAPYQITEWLVNGQPRTGVFFNLNGLVTLMNQLDPVPGWALQGGSLLRGGNPGWSYGPLQVKSMNNTSIQYEATVGLAPQGTEFRFMPGVHQLILKNVVNACADSTVVEVTCFDCLPIHSQPLDAFGNVQWEAVEGCQSDTVFCTNIPLNELDHYTINDNGQSFSQFSPCGNFVGMRLDTGFHLLYFQHESTGCTYQVRFYLNCREIVSEDTLEVLLPPGGFTSLCLDTSFLASPVAYLFNRCEDDAGSTVIDYSYNEQFWCVEMTGLGVGSDTLCLQLCDGSGQCANVLVYVTVSGQLSDSLLAVPDAAFTLKDTDLDIPILGNDIVNGFTGNRFALATVEFLTQPLMGTFSFSLLSGVFSYSPAPGACGIDSIQYRITDSLGQQSTASIRITIVCDKVFVFNGISPNGDGKNDVWHVLGIEQYPANWVQVYNRWGNLVFEQKGYRNETGWDGTWNGRAVPDGTYFYVIELGGGNGRQQGFIQLQR